MILRLLMETFSQPGCPVAWKEPWVKGAACFPDGLVVFIRHAGAEPLEGSGAH